MNSNNVSVSAPWDWRAESVYVRKSGHLGGDVTASLRASAVICNQNVRHYQKLAEWRKYHLTAT